MLTFLTRFGPGTSVPECGQHCNAPQAPCSPAPVHGTSREDRVAAVAQLIGDHRGAPNLWLARQILTILDPSPAFEGAADAAAVTGPPARQRWRRRAVSSARH